MTQDKAKHSNCRIQFMFTVGALLLHHPCLGFPDDPLHLNLAEAIKQTLKNPKCQNHG